jgi:hypothetical protein
MRLRRVHEGLFEAIVDAVYGCAHEAYILL